MYCLRAERIETTGTTRRPFYSAELLNKQTDKQLTCHIASLSPFACRPRRSLPTSRVSHHGIVGAVGNHPRINSASPLIFMQLRL